MNHQLWIQHSEDDLDAGQDWSLKHNISLLAKGLFVYVPQTQARSQPLFRARIKSRLSLKPLSCIFAQSRRSGNSYCSGLNNSVTFHFRIVSIHAVPSQENNLQNALLGNSTTFQGCNQAGVLVINSWMIALNSVNLKQEVFGEVPVLKHTIWLPHWHL